MLIPVILSVRHTKLPCFLYSVYWWFPLFFERYSSSFNKQSMVSKTSFSFLSVTFIGRSVCGLEECKWISSGFCSREKRSYRMWCVCLCNRMLRILMSTNQHPTLLLSVSYQLIQQLSRAYLLFLRSTSFPSRDKKNLDVIFGFDPHCFSVHACLYSFTPVFINFYIWT